jgi:hypothetical protein
MKFIFAILSLIYLILGYTLAQPVDVESNNLRSMDSRLAVPNINCIIHCVQPIGTESHDDDVQSRGIFANYATLLDCVKRCSS